MSASPIVIRDSPPTFKTPKLRSSCEECGSAKVKCVRNQPKCSRCTTLGLTCVYGISRKFGKPSRKRSRASFNTGGSSTFRNTALVPGQSFENHLGPGFERLPSFLATEITCLPSSQNAIGPGRDCSAGTNSAREEVRRSHGTALPGIPDLRDNSTSTLSNADDPTVNARQNETHIDSNFTTSYLLDELPQLDLWGPDMQIPLEIPYFSKDASIGNQPFDFMSPPVIQSTTDDESKSHSCPRGSYELFRDLICPSPLLHAPKSSSDTVMTRLDEVLHFNSEAIDRLGQLLECSCARSGHRIIVHASIISRILIWYQQAAGWSSGSSESSAVSPGTNSLQSDGSSSKSSPPSLSVTHTDATSPPVLDHSTGFSVDQGPVSVGSFHIQDQDVRDGFRNHLVLSELRKAAKVIELFAPQDTSICSMNPTSMLASHLGEWLRTEYQKTAKMLKKRISVLNQNLDC